MNGKTYDYLHNENDETANGDNECILRCHEKSSLKLRLSRVFSSGNLKSPKNSGSHFTFSDSRNSSPGQSPTIKLRYSWQTPSTSETSPKSRKSSVSSFTNSPDISKFICHIENGMKYSPKQQQKERKSESEIISTNGTPLKTFRCTNSTRRCIFNRINNDNNVISTGMFAWMRVFRMATLLPQVGC